MTIQQATIDAIKSQKVNIFNSEVQKNIFKVMVFYQDPGLLAALGDRAVCDTMILNILQARVEPQEKLSLLIISGSKLTAQMREAIAQTKYDVKIIQDSGLMKVLPSLEIMPFAEKSFKYLQGMFTHYYRDKDQHLQHGNWWVESGEPPDVIPVMAQKIAKLKGMQYNSSQDKKIIGDYIDGLEKYAHDTGYYRIAILQVHKDGLGPLEECVRYRAIVAAKLQTSTADLDKKVLTAAMLMLNMVYPFLEENEKTIHELLMVSPTKGLLSTSLTIKEIISPIEGELNVFLKYISSAITTRLINIEIKGEKYGIHDHKDLSPVLYQNPDTKILNVGDNFLFLKEAYWATILLGLNYIQGFKGAIMTDKNKQDLIKVDGGNFFDQINNQLDAWSVEVQKAAMDTYPTVVLPTDLIDAAVAQYQNVLERIKGKGVELRQAYTDMKCRKAEHYLNTALKYDLAQLKSMPLGKEKEIMLSIQKHVAISCTYRAEIKIAESLVECKGKLLQTCSDVKAMLDKAIGGINEAALGIETKKYLEEGKIMKEDLIVSTNAQAYCQVNRKEVILKYNEGANTIMNQWGGTSTLETAVESALKAKETEKVFDIKVIQQALINIQGYSKETKEYMDNRDICPENIDDYYVAITEMCGQEPSLCSPPEHVDL